MSPGTDIHTLLSVDILSAKRHARPISSLGLSIASSSCLKVRSLLLAPTFNFTWILELDLTNHFSATCALFEPGVHFAARPVRESHDTTRVTVEPSRLCVVRRTSASVPLYAVMTAPSTIRVHDSHAVCSYLTELHVELACLPRGPCCSETTWYRSFLGRTCCPGPLCRNLFVL